MASETTERRVSRSAVEWIKAFLIEHWPGLLAAVWGLLMTYLAAIS